MKLSELLSSEDKWTKGFYARDKDNREVGSANSFAVCWCLSGALFRINAPLTYRVKLNTIVMKRGFVSIVHFNDSPITTFQDVQEVIKEIENAIFHQSTD